MIARLLCTWGVFLLLFVSHASAQDPAESPPDAEKKFKVYDEGRRHGFGAYVLPPSRDCTHAKLEVVLQNGRATIWLKEVELGPASGAFKANSGYGKVEFILGTGNCRISIRAVPAE